VARAVIEFNSEISPLMPLINKMVKGCCYNPEAHLAAFNFNGHAVVLEGNKITIYGTENAEGARNILEWLKETLLDPVTTSSK
jgi:hypothetical protein